MKEERRKKKEERRKTKEERRKKKEERRTRDADGLHVGPVIHAFPASRGGARSAFTQVEKQSRPCYWGKKYFPATEEKSSLLLATIQLGNKKREGPKTSKSALASRFRKNEFSKNGKIP